MLSWHSLGGASLPESRDWLAAGEARRVASMRFTKRRTEWLLARWTAKHALAAEVGLPDDPASLARIEVRTIIGGAAQGAPEVFVDGAPRRIGISLTDRADWAVCVVGAIDELGCDLELVESRSDRFVRDFFTPREQAAVADPPFDVSGDTVANLIWSAKESALKVLRTGLRRDTRSVEVGFPAERSSAGWRPLRVSTEEGRDLPGWWRQYSRFLLTVVTGSAVPPPRPLVDPPGLASAEPSHSWLAAPRADRSG
ncbi:MAG TPA: 4'-phosphopantetheinyl transferase superfamily protein [Ilumatobacteraceae bacterium]|nr:4'-phosphopantetheinyl transferase superfamily protein [Ilumatobacteraceae bacterium]